MGNNNFFESGFNTPVTLTNVRLFVKLINPFGHSFEVRTFPIDIVTISALKNSI